MQAHGGMNNSITLSIIIVYYRAMEMELCYILWIIMCASFWISYWKKYIVFLFQFCAQNMYNT